MLIYIAIVIAIFIFVYLGFGDESVLLKHELAYVLGQMQQEYAVPKLAAILEDPNQDIMVRHEAGEALGAIGAPSALPALAPFLCSPSDILRETCALSYERLERLQDPGNIDYAALKAAPRTDLPFISVDPAVGESEGSAAELAAILASPTAPLYERYRAMFTLRNRQTTEAVLALAASLSADKSALFRHEIAYVLGQLAHPAAIPALSAQLASLDEHPMVRHECAEALGAIATPEANAILAAHATDSEPVVRESILVALDILAHENAPEFQYATATAPSFKDLKEKSHSPDATYLLFNL
jgi:deoxyhypusine monooxygenase